MILHVGTSAVATMKGSGRKDFSRASSTGHNASRCVGWRSGRISTPTGRAFSDHHKLSADAGATPRTKLLLSLFILPHYLLTTISMTPGNQQILQGSGFL